MRIRDANCEDLEKIKALCARNGLRGIVINSKIWKKEIVKKKTSRYFYWMGDGK